MVATSTLNSATTVQLVQGLSADDAVRVMSAFDYAGTAYGDKLCSSGQGAFEFAVGVASTLTLLDPAQAPIVEPRFGSAVSDLVAGVRQLIRLRELTQGQAQASARGRNAAQL